MLRLFLPLSKSDTLFNLVETEGRDFLLVLVLIPFPLYRSRAVGKAFPTEALLWTPT